MSRTEGGAIAAGRRPPAPEGLNAQWYQAAAGGILHVQSCADCGHRQHPPRYFCGACASAELVFQPVSSDNGTLYTWSVIHRSAEPGWSELVPYAIGVIQLAGGVRLVGYVDGIRLEDLRPGMPVTVRPLPQQDGAVVLIIRTAEASAR
jgi:uncharacterized protein